MQDRVNFDESWYLQAYPDVKVAIETGKLRSAWDHYSQHGKAEGRSPQRMTFHRVFAHGAYGTNNVGDEAIYEGIKVHYPQCIQIFINKTHVQGALWYWDVIRQDEFFRGDDLLIIGGGGLLYARQAVIDMINLARKARAAGATVHLLGLGCEAAQPEYYAEIRTLVSLASKVTVRTSLSRAILRDICGSEPEQQEDFAFSLRQYVAPGAGSVGRRARIGVVTGGDMRVSYAELVAAIRSVTEQLPVERREVNFVHIPHSMAYVSPANNDLTVGHGLWSSVGMATPHTDDYFTVDSFTPNPLERLRRYRDLDGVISARFHGLIFAEIVGVPALALWGATAKNRSLLEDRQRPGLFASRDDSDLRAQFDRFIAYVLGNRRRYRESTGGFAAPRDMARVSCI